MKNWLIGRILGFIGKRLDGYKTKLGGVSFIVMGVAGIIAEMFPDQGLPRPGLETSLGYISGGFTILGLGHKMEKARAEIVRTTPIPAVLEATAPAAQAPPRNWVPGLCPEEEERAAIEQKNEPEWDGRIPGQFP